MKVLYKAAPDWKSVVFHMAEMFHSHIVLQCHLHVVVQLFLLLPLNSHYTTAVLGKAFQQKRNKNDTRQPAAKHETSTKTHGKER